MSMYRTKLQSATLSPWPLGWVTANGTAATAMARTGRGAVPEPIALSRCRYRTTCLAVAHNSAILVGRSRLEVANKPEDFPFQWSSPQPIDEWKRAEILTGRFRTS